MTRRRPRIPHDIGLVRCFTCVRWVPSYAMRNEVECNECHRIFLMLWAKLPEYGEPAAS